MQSTRNQVLEFPGIRYRIPGMSQTNSQEFGTQYQERATLSSQELESKVLGISSWYYRELWQNPGNEKRRVPRNENPKY